MGNQKPAAKISKLVEDLMPNATYEEKLDATQNLRGYLDAVYSIFIRLESEGKVGDIRKKSLERDKLEADIYIETRDT